MPDSSEPPLLFPQLGRAAQLLSSNSLPEDILGARRVLTGQAPLGVVRAALTLRSLRQRAALKFRKPGLALLLPKGLEQATDGRVAAWRAAEIHRMAPQSTVWDCTTGLAADAIALVERGIRVLASDSSRLLAAVAHHNLNTKAPGNDLSLVFTADATRPALGNTADLVLLLDPDRRANKAPLDRGSPGGGRQRLDPTSFSPPFESWGTLLGQVAGAAVKLPPGLDPDVFKTHGMFADFLAKTPHRWTWIETGGRLREMTLWTGTLAQEGLPSHSAVRLLGSDFPPPGISPDHAVLSLNQSFQSSHQELPDPEAITMIAEVRPSARRAGLAHQASSQALATLVPINEMEDYFASSTLSIPTPTPFVDFFRVLASAPLDKKRVRRITSQWGIGPLTIKKRGLPESSATLERRLGGKKGLHGLAIATPTRAGRRLFLVERIGP